MENKRLYSPSYIKQLLEAYGFRFSKSLGQNFLIDGNIVRGIVDSSEITKEDYVLEIGPGIGTLTEELSLKAKKVVSIEIDKNLIPILDETLKDKSNVEIIYGDVLQVDLKKIIDEKLGGGPIKVVANLPYYITTPIIARLLEEELNLESITVMVQKEVAARIISKSGSKDYGSLSVFIQFYTEAEIVLDVPKSVFMPQPRVDSAVIKLNVKKEIPQVDKEKFFKVVKTSFAMRRKTLLNCLSSGEFKMEKEDIKHMLNNIGIDPKIRAERLEIEEFIKITDNIK